MVANFLTKANWFSVLACKYTSMSIYRETADNRLLFSTTKCMGTKFLSYVNNFSWCKIPEFIVTVLGRKMADIKSSKICSVALAFHINISNWSLS